MLDSNRLEEIFPRGYSSFSESVGSRDYSYL
ncbi:hypothetical protein LINPERPRIM_LOCUS8975 [Linum perenne]